MDKTVVSKNSEFFKSQMSKDPDAYLWSVRMGKNSDSTRIKGNSWFNKATPDEIKQSRHKFINQEYTRMKRMNQFRSSVPSKLEKINSASSEFNSKASFFDEAINKKGIDYVTSQRSKTTNLYKGLFPEKYQKLQDKLINPHRDMISAAFQAGDWKKLDKLKKGFGDAMHQGEGRFSRSMATRLMMDINIDQGKANARMASKAVSTLNSISKAGLGASLGQLAFAGSVIAGMGYVAGSAMGISGKQAAQVAGDFHQSLKENPHRAKYGSSQLGQSTQGLVHGLHNRRRG
jgi:hypothetical protein